MGYGCEQRPQLQRFVRRISVRRAGDECESNCSSEAGAPQSHLARVEPSESVQNSLGSFLPWVLSLSDP